MSRFPFTPRRPPPGTGGPLQPNATYHTPDDVGSWTRVAPQPTPPVSTPGVPGATPFSTGLQWLIRALGLTSNVVPQGLGQLPLDPVMDVVQRGWALATWKRVSYQIAPTLAPPTNQSQGLIFVSQDTQIVTALSIWQQNDAAGYVTFNRQLLVPDGDVSTTLNIRAPALYQGVIPGQPPGGAGNPSRNYLAWSALDGNKVWIFPPGQQLWCELVWPNALDAGNIMIDIELATLPGMFQGR